MRRGEKDTMQISSDWALFLVGTMLAIIIYEIRQLRNDIKTCVPDKTCKIMMSAHEERIDKLERKINHEN